ncbi:MAG: hypothetical protein MI922_27290, partial [Bacteroidales bacterium]|nr:hypothetical protein [Bacteroidales bacterium]
IIAYRISEDYCEETINGETCKYSNSFAIVQHRYESPTKKPDGKTPEFEFAFYSLYHHLLPASEINATGRIWWFVLMENNIQKPGSNFNIEEPDFRTE